MKRFIYLLICLILIAAGVGVYYWQQDTAPMPTLSQLSPLRLIAIMPHYQTNTPQIKLIGTVNATHQTLVVNSIPGEVQAIHIKSGQLVSKGQLLISLFNSPEKFKFKHARLELSSQHAKQTQAETDYQHKRISLAKLNTIKKQTQSLEDLVIKLNTYLEATQIQAPVSGAVDNLYVHVNQTIKAGTPLLKIQGKQGFHYITFIPEQYLETFKQLIHDQARATAFYHHKIPLVLDGINLSVTPTHAGFKAVYKVMGDYQPPKGSTAGIRADLKSVPNSLSLPFESLYISEAHQPYLLTVNEQGKLNSVKVEIKGKQFFHHQGHHIIITTPEGKLAQMIVIEHVNKPDQTKQVIPIYR